MTTFEIEQKCKDFLKTVFDDTQPARALTARFMMGEVEEEDFQKQIMEIVNDSKTYTDYAKEMAQFVKELAKEA